MESKNSLIPSQILLDKVSSQIAIVDKYLANSESEEWIAFFISNPRFFRLLMSLFYPFTLNELIEYKSKIILGNVERGVDYPLYDEYEDEDYESEEYYHDENSFEYNYGLIFNTKVEWQNEQVFRLFGFSSPELNFPNDWEGDISLNLPITIEQIKDMEKEWFDNNSMVEYNDINQEEDEIIQNYLKEHGLRGYSTDGYTGEIVDPPGLAKLLKETTKLQREKISAKVQEEFDKVDAEYEETIKEKIDLDAFKTILDKDDLFLLKNPKIWDLTLKEIIDESTIRLIFSKI